MGLYLGGTKPKEENPLQEYIRYNYFKLCKNINYSHPNLVEIVLEFAAKSGLDLDMYSISELDWSYVSCKYNRIFESFAAVVYEMDELKRFDNADACNIVLNAIVMLNSSLHHPRVKERDKLKKSKFVELCTNIKNANMLTSDYEQLYEYIKTNPMKSDI